jgi:drug/metabolite transporter (DMT)-like permease
MTDAVVFTASGRRPRVAHRVGVRPDEPVAWLALVAGIALQAVVTALMGLSLTAADSLLMLVFAAVACTLLGAVAARRNRRVSVGRIPGLRQLVWLNMWTAVSFVAFFLGVAVDGAAVVFTLEATFAPLGVTAWTAFFVHRGGTQPVPGAAQWWPACLLAVVGMSLVAGMAPPDSGGRIALVVAAMLGVVAGVAAGGLVIVSRRLGCSGVGVGQVMAHRFYATGTFVVTALLTLVPCGLLTPPALNVGLIGVAALACIVAPLFLLQYAMQRLAPVSVAAALATMPAITIAIELASGRAMSWIVLLGGALIVPGNLALLVTQQQKRVSPRLSALHTTFFNSEHRTQPTAPSQ